MAAFLVLNFTGPAQAHGHVGNQWEGNERRWPWQYGAGWKISGLVHHANESCAAHLAVDATPPSASEIDRMLFSLIDSAVYSAKKLSDDAAGKWLQLEAGDGYYVYEHLDTFSAAFDDAGVLTGPGHGYLATAGKTGNASGIHLHLQRHDRPVPPFGPTGGALCNPLTDPQPLSLFPINGESSVATGASYRSANAGVGYSKPNSEGKSSNAAQFLTAWSDKGGYDTVGVTAFAQGSWYPCIFNSLDPPTPWRYRCDQPDASGSTHYGDVQLFFGPDDREQALMLRRDPADNSVIGGVRLLHRGILGIFGDYAPKVPTFQKTVGDRLGYPTGDRTGPAFDFGIGAVVYRQEFQDGVIYQWPTTDPPADPTVPNLCHEEAYENGWGLIKSASYCDWSGTPIQCAPCASVAPARPTADQATDPTGARPAAARVAVGAALSGNVALNSAARRR